MDSMAVVNWVARSPFYGRARPGIREVTSDRIGLVVNLHYNDIREFQCCGASQ